MSIAQTPSSLVAANEDANDPNTILDRPANRVLTFSCPVSLGIPEAKDAGPYMQINAYEYTRGINAIVNPNKKFQVRLPLPGNLSDGYSGDYEQFTVNPITGALQEQFSQSDMAELNASLGDAAAAISKGGLAGLGGVASSFMAGKMASKIVGKRILDVAFKTLLDKDTRNYLSASTGLALNPRTEVAFNGMNIRSHDYVFDLIPRNEEESRQVLGMIDVLRVAMHPDTLDSNHIFLKYPYEFTIGFYTADGQPLRAIPFVPDSFLSGFNVNYNASTPGRLHSDDKPLSYRLQFSFTETNILTRKNIQLFDALRTGVYETKTAEGQTQFNFEETYIE